MRKSWVRGVLGLTLATVLMSGAMPASAQGGGGLQVSPIRLDLGAKQRGGALTLTNTTESKKTVQVDVVAWSQKDGDDVYTPSRELLANPPLFFLEPGASQVVRIGLAASSQPSSAERPYRVFLREVPDEKPTESSALRVVVRLGVPVFAAPATPIAAKPQWSAHLQRDGSVNVVLDNPGTAHLRAAQVRLLAEQGDAVIGQEPSLRYVLAGSRQVWHVKPATPVKPGPARISALMEDGAREFAVVVQAD